MYAFCLQLIAFWSVWRYLALRYALFGEDVWGIISLGCIIGFSIFWQSKQAKVQTKSSAFFLAAFFLLTYAASFVIAPPLLRAVLAMISLTFFLSGWRYGTLFHTGIFALLLLSLPLMASLNFFIGFPLRVIVGEAVKYLLQLQGLEVIREGVCLHFGEKLIWIDAPCSGIKMLWFGMFLTGCLICIYELKFWKSVTAFALAFATIIVGNIFRASALFYTEAEIIQAPVWMHEAVGVFSFALTAVGIIFIVKQFAELRCQK